MGSSMNFLSMQAKYIVAGCLMFVYLLVFSSLMIYWTVLFVRERECILFRKRLPNITITICIIFIIDNIIASYSLIELFGISTSYETIDEYIQITRDWCVMGYRACFILKFWCIFYDINYIRITVNSQWHSIIDPTINNNQTLFKKTKTKINKISKNSISINNSDSVEAFSINHENSENDNKTKFLSYGWFIKHKKTLGNEIFMMKIIFLIYILVVSITTTLQVIKLSHLYIYFCIFHFVCKRIFWLF